MAKLRKVCFQMYSPHTVREARTLTTFRKYAKNNFPFPTCFQHLSTILNFPCFWRSFIKTVPITSYVIISVGSRRPRSTDHGPSYLHGFQRDAGYSVVGYPECPYSLIGVLPPCLYFAVFANVAILCNKKMK